jgi:DivIVA domain-containing protein
LRHFSPEDIESYQFLYSMPGYNRAEVRAFLKAIAAQVRDLQQRLNEGATTQPQSEIEDAVTATEDATRRALDAAEARMKTAGSDLRAELDAFRLQMADLIGELTVRVEEVASASGPSAADRPEPADTEPPVATQESRPPESDELRRESEGSEERVEPRVVPSGPIATSPGGEEQEIPPEWAELMREPENEE